MGQPPRPHLTSSPSRGKLGDYIAGRNILNPRPHGPLPIKRYLREVLPTLVNFPTKETPVSAVEKRALTEPSVASRVSGETKMVAATRRIR